MLTIIISYAVVFLLMGVTLIGAYLMYRNEKKSKE